MQEAKQNPRIPKPSFETRERPYVVEVPTPEGERRREIRVADWERVKREISLITEESWLDNFLDNAPWALFGIAISTGLTLFLLDKESFVYAIYMCGCLASLSLGSILLLINKQRRKERVNFIELIKEDMKQIEETFIREERELEKEEPDSTDTPLEEDEEIDVKDIPL